MVRFRAKLEPIEGGTFVVIPADVVEALGATGRTSVVGTIDGHPIRHQFMPYVFEGVGRQVVMAVNKATRQAIGKVAGDSVAFDLERDERSRSANVEIPDELADVLAKDPAARAAFDALAPSRRREHADHVAAAKRPETRRRRAADVVTRLGHGVRPRLQSGHDRSTPQGADRQARIGRPRPGRQGPRSRPSR